MRKKILTSMLLFSTTLFAMEHSNHNMQHNNTNEVANQSSSLTIPKDTKCKTEHTKALSFVLYESLRDCNRFHASYILFLRKEPQTNLYTCTP